MKKLTAYWVNVDECIQRREFMIEQFEKINCIEKNIRISAVTPDDIDLYVHPDDLPFCCDPSKNLFKNCTNCKVEHCALISHMKAIEQGYNDGHDWFIIFEDDTIIAHDIDWEAMFRTIPADAEVLQLFCSMPTTINKLYEIREKLNTEWLPWRMIIPSASGYVISRKGAQKMCKLFKQSDDKWRFKDSKECRLADAMTYATCNTYTHTYPLFYPNIFLGSLIHPEHLHSHQAGIDAIKHIINENKIKGYVHPFAKLNSNKN